MTTDLWLRNLGAFGLQSGVLVAGGCVLAKVFGLDNPRAALAYWRALLAACLLLPFCQPWHEVMITPAVVAALPAAVTDAVAKSLPHANVASEAGWPSVERLIATALWIGWSSRTSWKSTCVIVPRIGCCW